MSNIASANVHFRPFGAVDDSMAETVASEYTGIPIGLLQELRATGQGPVFHIRDGQYRYRPENLNSWLKNQSSEEHS